jgi:NAD(P)-dependent dehydrogenase (short-subunit alcohol dehydrogenase family)
MNNSSLSGRVSLVTGAAGLLGYQHAYALLEAGSTVVLTDICESTLSHTCQSLQQIFPGATLHSFICDVSSESSISCLVDQLHSSTLMPHFLVNNAAINPSVSSTGVISSSHLEAFDPQSFSHELNVGLTGAILTTKYFGSYMAKNFHNDCIVNISSDLSVIAPDQRIYNHGSLDKAVVKPVLYSVIKHALIGLTKYTSTYWVDSDVRCNALSPGGIFVNQPDDFVSQITKLIPLSHMAKAEDYRSAIQFLCSDTSSYMTGQNLIIDGGRSVW